MSHKIIFLNCFDLKCHYVTVFWKSLCVLFYNCTELKISVIKFWPSLWSCIKFIAQTQVLEQTILTKFQAGLFKARDDG